MLFTVRTTTSCDSPDGGVEETYDGQIKVEDVAIVSAISVCKYDFIDCNAQTRCEAISSCANCLTDIDCSYVIDEMGSMMCKASADVQAAEQLIEACPQGTSWRGVKVTGSQNCAQAGYEYIDSEE